MSIPPSSDANAQDTQTRDDEFLSQNINNKKFTICFRVLSWIINHGLGNSSDNTAIVGREALELGAGVEMDLEVRVRMMLNRLGSENTNLDLLERTWRDEFARAPAGVSVSRLQELLKDCSSQYYQSSDDAEIWRRKLSFLLNTELHRPAVLPDPGEDSPVDELDLRDIGVNWPKELLGTEAFRMIPSLSPGEVPDLPLDGTWVELQLVDSKAALDGDISPQDSGAVYRRSQQLLRRSIDDLKSVLVRMTGITYLVGDPGSGKSTLINWVARESIRDQNFPFLLPLLVRFRDYGRQDPNESILAHALGRCGVVGQQRELWAQALVAMAKRDPKSVVLLLDGLDELSLDNKAGQAHVLREIETLRRDNFTVIVTTRPSALPATSSRNGARTYRITDLSPAGSDELLGKWCSAARMQPTETEKLKELVYGSPDLQQMIRNPFLLTCLSTIAFRSLQTGEPIPTQRAEVYQRCLGVFKSYRHPKQIRLLNDTDLRHMSRLAYWLYAEAPGSPRLLFDIGDVKEACGDGDFFSDAVEPCRLVHQWDTHSAILYFSHTTFHEYLAADHLFKGDKKTVERVLLEKRFDRRWAEVFSFLGAKDANPEGIFWHSARQMAERPDLFGGVFLILARWVREARDKEYGKYLLGRVKVFDELLKEAFKGVDPKRFITAAAELHPEEFARRFEVATQASKGDRKRFFEVFMDIDPEEFSVLFEKASAGGTIGTLHGEFLRILKQTPLPHFSNLFVDEVLNPSNDSSSIPQEHRLTLESLARLRQELEGKHHDERVLKRVIQLLGLAKDFRAIPLLDTLASQPGPLQNKAIEALGLIGGFEAFSVLDRLLDRLLQSGNRETELNLVIGGLGNMYEERATSRLLHLLAAVSSLDDPRAGVILRALQDHRISRDTAPIVCNFLSNSPDMDVRDYAACVLYDVANTPEISESLALAAQFDEEEFVRESALLSFESHSRPSDLIWLEAIVRNSTYATTNREAALMSIGDLAVREKKCIDHIRGLLEYCLTQNGLEKTAVNIWGRLDHTNAEPIIKLCEQVLEFSSEHVAKVDNDVAEEACRVLGEQKNRDALNVLLSIARSEQVVDQVREAAARAITGIAPESLLAETSEVCRRILGQFSLETGRFVFDSGILSESGSLVSPAPIVLTEPMALIMQGGGIKGLAYVGALEILDRTYQFNWYIGTSAGAITAILLGAGYTVSELVEILRSKNFTDFLDAKWYQIPINLLFHKGCYRADSFTRWIEELLAKKLGSEKRVDLSDLPKRVTVYACQSETDALTFDSNDWGWSAAFAARCSMSIPFYFVPQLHQGIRVYDGGIKYNFPLKKVFTDNPYTQFKALYLGKEIYEGTDDNSVPGEVLSILNSSDRDTIAAHRDSTIIIDTRPIKTLDFSLTNEEKEYLLQAGRAAALRYLNETSEEYKEAVIKRDKLKKVVIDARNVLAAKRRRWLWVVVITLVIIILISNINW